jgi:hypothetical protein
LPANLLLIAACLLPGCLQDILIQGEGGAQILVDPELVEHFEVGAAGHFEPCSCETCSSVHTSSRNNWNMHVHAAVPRADGRLTTLRTLMVPDTGNLR